jgi:hypothetical protein
LGWRKEMQISNLVLEDSMERVKLFKKYDLKLVHVEHVKDCIEQIELAEVIETLWLDHDLGGQIYVKSESKDCGFEVVRYLQKHDHKAKIKQIHVHSHNGYAAPYMTQDLQAAGYNVRQYPFHQFKLNFELSNIKQREQK